MKNAITKDDYLAKRFIDYFQEVTELPQDDFLKSQDWVEKIKEDLPKKQTVVAVICDLKGGGVLMRSGEFVSTMQKVIKGISAWRNNYNETAFVRKRSFGEDEFLLYFKPKSDSAIPEILLELKEAIKRETKEDSVYIAAVQQDKDTEMTYSELIKLTDKSLFLMKKKVKENPNDKKNFEPLISVAKEYTTKTVTTTLVSFPEKVVTQNSIETLMNVKGVFYLFSPDKMKSVNDEQGFAGGDKVLKQLSINLLDVVNSETTSENKIYKIGTMFAVLQNKFSEEQLEKIANNLPFGLLYTFVNKN